jgi:hypothetical protein
VQLFKNLMNQGQPGQVLPLCIKRHVRGTIPIIYLPLMMITHIAAFYFLVGPQSKAARGLVGDAAAS